MNEPNRPKGSFCGRTRREFLWQGGLGFTSLGLVDLLSRDGFFGRSARAGGAPTDGYVNPMAPKPPHFEPKAKSVIFLFMYGGPSHVDTFDYKPELFRLDGKTIDVKTKGRGGSKDQGRIVGPKWHFRRHGESGQWISDLFPHLATCADDLAMIRSMTAESPLHGSAMLQMNSGKIVSGSPCLGSWATYGLGSVNEDLPGFVVMLDPVGGPISGAKNWSSGYMPSTYQGTIFRSQGEPIIDLSRPAGVSRGDPAPPARHARTPTIPSTWPRGPTSRTWRRVSPASSSPTRCRSPRRRRPTSRPSPRRRSGSTGSTIRRPRTSAAAA